MNEDMEKMRDTVPLSTLQSSANPNGQALPGASASAAATVGTSTCSNIHRKDMINNIYRSLPGFISLMLQWNIPQNIRAYQVTLVRDAVWQMVEKTFV